MNARRSTLIGAVLCATNVYAQQTISVRTLSAPSATSAVTVGSIVTPREVPIIDGLYEIAGGRVIVNDQARRQLVVFDAELARVTVLADSNGTGGWKYPGSKTMLIQYLGDSTLFVDPEARSFVLVGPAGTRGRIVAPPRVQDLNYMFNNGAGVDARGRLLYHAFLGFPAIVQRRPRATAGSQQSCLGTTALRSDSATLLRADFDTRRVDSVTKFKTPHPVRARGTLDSAGKLLCAYQQFDPVGPSVDSWVTTSTGEVAIVRGFDYHIDWIAADGSPGASPKLPFDWRRVTDDDKQLRAATARKTLDSLAAAGWGPMLRQCTITSGGSLTNVVPSREVAELPAGSNGCASIPVTVEIIPAADMPDYIPPIRAGTVAADRDGNVWLLPTTSLAATAGAGPVYDVVNRTQGLVERVRLPLGRQIAGFGRGGVVYLTWRDPSGGWRIERTRVIRN